MLIEEINRIKPAYFYEAVSKKTGVDVKTIEYVYTKFLVRVDEMVKTELKIFILGLGTFERHPNNLITIMYDIDGFIRSHSVAFNKGVISIKALEYISRMEFCFSELEKLKIKYKYIEKSIEKFWTNCGGLKEFFDEQGRIRKNFSIEETSMRDMPPEFNVEEEE